MITPSLPPIEGPLKENLRQPRRSVSAAVIGASSSRHLFSRHTARSLSKRARTVIHVRVRPENSNHRLTENKSAHSAIDLRSIPSGSTPLHFQNHISNSHVTTPSSAGQPKSATHSLRFDEMSGSDRLLIQSSNNSFSQEHNDRNDQVVSQKNHFPSNTNRILPRNFSSSTVFRSNNQIMKKEDWSSNARDLLENSGKKKQKKSSNSLTRRCRCALVSLITALLLAGALAGTLAAILIKSDTTTTTTYIIPEMNSTTDTTSTSSTTSAVVTTTSLTTSTTFLSSTTSTTTESTSITATTTNSISTTTVQSIAGATPSSSIYSYGGTETVKLNCTGTLKNLTIQIFVKKVYATTYNAMYGSYWGGTMNATNTSNSTHIIYTWSIVSGQTITCSAGPYTYIAQFNSNGTAQITTGDTYVVTTTSSTGVTNVLEGHF